MHGMAPSAHSQAKLPWSVSLPEREASAPSFGRQKPRATIAVTAPDGSIEELSVPVSVGKAARSRLRSGELVPASRNELVYLLRRLQETKARDRIAGLINRRDYSSHELRKKLLADGYWRDIVETCVARAVETGIVNDTRYADVFIHSKAYAGWGRSRIERGLAQKGIDPADIPGWPDVYLPEEGEGERAYEVASHRRFTGKDPYAKVVHFLGSRGFSLGVAHSVASRLKDEGAL